MRKILTSLAAIAGAAALAAPASAAIHVQFFPGAGVGTAVPSYTTAYDFDGLSPAAINVISGAYVIQNTSNGSGAAIPVSNPGGTNYLSVLGNGEVSFDLPAAYGFAFEWGSLDSFNSLIVIQLGGGEELLIPGEDLLAGTGSNGDQQAPGTNGTLHIWGDAGEVFTGLQLSSGQNSFEIDNVRIQAVPEASTWAMMIAGLGLVGFAMRRKRNVAVSFA